MKVLLSILIVLFSPYSFSQDYPDMTPENIRWMIPADAWKDAEIYAMKSFIYLENPQKISFFLNKEFEGKPVLEIDEKSNVVTTLSECQNFFNKPLVHKTANLKCGYQFCDAGNFNNVIDSFPLKENVQNVCKLPVIFSRFNYKNESLNFDDSIKMYIPFQKGNLNKQVLKINWHNQTIYAPLPMIKDKDVFLVSKSLWEKQWLNLKKHQFKKDLASLNYFIEKLLPCVKRKDKLCVGKYFLNEELQVNDNGSRAFNDFDRSGGMKREEITDDILEELEMCLKYESLMPHLLSLKGKNKACIPYKSFQYSGDSSQGNWDLKFDHITFPEAVRYSASRQFIYLSK